MISFKWRFLRATKADYFLSNCSDLFLVNIFKSRLKTLKELLNHVKRAAPRAMLCSYKNAQKLLLAIITQITVTDNFCCENIYTSAVQQYMNCLKLPSHKINVFLMMGNGKDELCRQPVRNAIALSDTQAQEYCSKGKLWCGRCEEPCFALQHWYVS